jgi:hypothetical protein
MNGRVFDVLESCTIISPHNHHALPTRGTTLPNCRELTLRCYPLRTLRAFSVPALDCLEVGCQNLDKRRGDTQFASVHVVQNISNLRILCLNIEVTEYTLVHALNLMPALEELALDLASPSSLGESLFVDLMAKPLREQSWDLLPVGAWRSSCCPALVALELKYRRWLRRSEEFKLPAVFAALVWTRKRTNAALQRFTIIPPPELNARWDFVGEPMKGIEAFKLPSSGVTGPEKGHSMA